MSEALKKKVFELYNEKHNKNKDDNIEKNVQEIVDSMIKNKKDIEVYSDSTDDDLSYSEDENSNNINVKIEETAEYNAPYCYIDYNIDSINLAKKNKYKTIHIKKGGLTPSLINKIVDENYFAFKKTHVIINLWHVLTKSNLGNFSINCSTYDDRKFITKFENTIKWGSKQFLKEKLNKKDQRSYSLFLDGTVELLRLLSNNKVKIFIVCNADYSFVKRIFQHYQLDKYIEEYFTPSRCVLPHGRITSQMENYKDNKKMNKERMFVCIERYMGRLPIDIA